MKAYVIKFKKRSTRGTVYDIIVTKNVKRSTSTSLEVLGTFNTNQPVKYCFINVERLSMCVKMELLFVIQF